MTQALELRNTGAQPVAMTSDQLKFISRTDFVPKALRGNMPAILACVATGRELGLGDMTSLRSIHIVDGKATFSAELMVQLVRKAGHSITGTVDAEKATVTGTRRDNGDTMTVEWTIEMAKRIGLLSKDNWKRYPEAMLWARAASQLCRMLFPDCFAGASYTPEEVAAGAENAITGDELLYEDAPEPIEQLRAELEDLADTLDLRAVVDEAIAEHGDDPGWLREQIDNARATIAERENEASKAEASSE